MLKGINTDCSNFQQEKDLTFNHVIQRRKKISFNRFWNIRQKYRNYFLKPKICTQYFLSFNFYQSAIKLGYSIITVSVNNIYLFQQNPLNQ